MSGHHPICVMTSHPPRRTLHPVFSDTRIENAVRAALLRDSRIKHPELIAISVDEIGTVVLRGAVSSFPQRLAAANDARQIERVPAVIADGLEVYPPVRNRRDDDVIRAVALEHLGGDSRIRSTHVVVKVSNGHVTLTGYLREESEGAAAVEDVAGFAGVVGVTNQIEIR